MLFNITLDKLRRRWYRSTCLLSEPNYTGASISCYWFSPSAKYVHIVIHMLVVIYLYKICQQMISEGLVVSSYIFVCYAEVVWLSISFPMVATVSVGVMHHVRMGDGY